VSDRNIHLGKSGEELAGRFLKENGYQILAKNYRSRFGEIDIVAREKDCICFIEVKARKDTDFGLPQEAVDFRKQRKISKVALAYLKESRLLDAKARFDVVSVLFEGAGPRIKLTKNAFELSPQYGY
jgi:putative endonuclease